jgi:hypothetical protein
VSPQYSKLSVRTPNDWFFCSVSDTYKKWQQLGKRRDLQSWEMFPSTVNAYFNPPSNEVWSTVTLLGIHFLQTLFAGCVPCWYPSSSFLLPRLVRLCLGGYNGHSLLNLGDRPNYLSYGSFGHVAAHELTVSLLLVSCKA